MMQIEFVLCVPTRQNIYKLTKFGTEKVQNMYLDQI